MMPYQPYNPTWQNPSLMQVLDEHMSALAVVQPREYESLMGRVRALRQTR